jgi:peptidyl-prolyl cis-trans isomerase C
VLIVIEILCYDIMVNKNEKGEYMMENKTLAIISGVEIKESDLDAIIKRYPEDRRSYFASEMGRKQVLEQMIAFELMNKLGLEMALDKTEEYKASLMQMEKDLLTQMTINKVLSEVTVTDEEAQKYYDEHTEEFKEKETVSAKHILVETLDQCEDIKLKVEKGELTFEEAAKKYSSCPSKDQGGSLGVFGRGMMVPEFEKAAFESEINKVSEPVQTQFGYHLIMVDAKNEQKVSSFNEVKNQIISKLIQGAQEKKYMDIIKNLEAKYDVKRV